MARVNINILGIRQLEWMGMGKFNSDNHYIYYCDVRIEYTKVEETLSLISVEVKILLHR